MSDYKDMGINGFYQPYNAPVTSGTTQSGYDFQNQTERDAVTNTQMRSISADKVTAGTIDATVIYGGSITGNQIAGGTLILGGTLNGDGLMQIKNSAGTVLIQGDNQGHSYYTDAGVLQIKVDEDGLVAYQADGTTKQFQLSASGFYGYGTTSQIIRFKTDPSSTANYGGIGYGTAKGLGMYITTPETMLTTAGGDPWVTADGQAVIVGEGNNATLYADGSGGTAEVLAVNDINIYAGDKITIQTGSGDINLSSSDDIVGTAVDDVIFNYGGDFILNGSTKTAIVPTTQGYKALYAIESPSVWFMDFVEKKDVLDPLFIEVTEPPYKYIKCDDGTYQVWGKRKGYKDTRFESKDVKQFEVNNKLYSGDVVRDVEKVRQDSLDRIQELKNKLIKS